LWTMPASAAIMFSETFGGPALPSTLTYSSSPSIAWSINGAGQLFADYDGSGSSVTVTALTNAGFIAPAGMSTIYSLDAGTPTGILTGEYNIGMQLGDYRILFHPGFTNIPGAFRIEGGFDLANTNMGFVPALGVMHHIDVTTQMVGGGLAVDIAVTGLGTDSLTHTFNYSFLDTTPGLGTGTFGGRRSGGGANVANDAFFDNYQVQFVPEPSVALLLVLGACVMTVLRRRKRRG
ncbi:MAG: PEP-CTERM sorting domain-containing protein, partial [Patescibacteria group bacterium]|nr:PEP-CTERM sorting domain-containing protein [Patescibacteria group bacterium]